MASRVSSVVVASTKKRTGSPRNRTAPEQSKAEEEVSEGEETGEDETEEEEKRMTKRGDNSEESDVEETAQKKFSRMMVDSSSLKRGNVTMNQGRRHVPRCLQPRKAESDEEDDDVVASSQETLHGSEPHKASLRKIHGGTRSFVVAKSAQAHGRRDVSNALRLCDDDDTDDSDDDDDADDSDDDDVILSSQKPTPSRRRRPLTSSSKIDLAVKITPLTADAEEEMDLFDR